MSSRLPGAVALYQLILNFSEWLSVFQFEILRDCSVNGVWLHRKADSPFCNGRQGEAANSLRFEQIILRSFFQLQFSCLIQTVVLFLVAIGYGYDSIQSPHVPSLANNLCDGLFININSCGKPIKAPARLLVYLVPLSPNICYRS